MRSHIKIILKKKSSAILSLPRYLLFLILNVDWLQVINFSRFLNSYCTFFHHKFYEKMVSRASDKVAVGDIWYLCKHTFSHFHPIFKIHLDRNFSSTPKIKFEKSQISKFYGLDEICIEWTNFQTHLISNIHPFFALNV